MNAEKLRREIDLAVEQNQGWPGRRHLGWSVLGRQCPRQVWYSFRWAKMILHTGRMLRLWQRGHDEEPRIVKWLRDIGAVVSDVHPETGEQFRRARFANHFGGATDGVVSNLERFGAQGYGLLECKTHNASSFKAVKGKGVVTSKPEHFVQMQGYMYDHGLPWALYVAVNKNDDEVYCEFVSARTEVAERYLDRAKEIIGSRAAPPRISEDPSWMVCKFCDYREICHKGHGPDKNCRSCIYAAADTENGGWYCDRWHAAIPDSVIRDGCDLWDPIQ